MSKTNFVYSLVPSLESVKPKELRFVVVVVENDTRNQNLSIDVVIGGLECHCFQGISADRANE